jgi:hypothetical protein
MSVDASAEASAEEVGGGAPSSPVDGDDEPPLMFADVQAAQVVPMDMHAPTEEVDEAAP